MRVSSTQIYQGSLGAVTVAVRNIVSSSPNFASAGRLLSYVVFMSKIYMPSRYKLGDICVHQQIHVIPFSLSTSWLLITNQIDNISHNKPCLYYCTSHICRTGFQYVIINLFFERK